MKKELFVMAIASVALAGCVSDEVEDVVKKAELTRIGFSAPVLYNNAESRAQIVGEYELFTYTAPEPFPGTYSYPREEKFMVFSSLYSTPEFVSWSNGTNYWNTEALEVEYDQDVNGWTSTTPYYWPAAGQKLAFAAYSPADLVPEGDTDQPTVSYAETGLKIENFKVADEPTKQFELLYSARTFNNTANESGSAGTYNGAKIKFKHALSSIHFAVKKDADVTTKIYLRKLVLKNVKNEGTFNENITDEVSNTSSPYWNSQIGTETYTTYDVKTAAKGVEFTTTTPVHVHEASKNIAEDYSSPLLMIPQNLPVTIKDAEGNVTQPGLVAEVTYMIGEDPSITSNVKTVTVDLGNRTGKDIANDGKDVVVNQWLPGKKYTYVLNYTQQSHAKDQIYFAPETTGWERINLININLH